MAWLVRILVAVVVVSAAANWIGWAAGVKWLTRIHQSWPQMTPWTAALLALSAVALGAQAGRPSPIGVRVGRALAATVAVLSLVFLAEYATGTSFGVDLAFFPAAVTELQSTWPGRPSPQTASSFLMLSAAILVHRNDRPWARRVWAAALALATAIPLLVLLSYLTGTLPFVRVAPSTGVGISTALGFLTLVAATISARPDRNPVAWLLARPDRAMLTQTAAVLAGLPLLTGLAHLGFDAVVPHDGAWVLALALSTAVVAAATFFITQHGSRRLAASEERFRLLAENASDVITHIRDGRFVWISPSVEVALGAPPSYWIGRDISAIVPPDEYSALAGRLESLKSGEVVKERVRLSSRDGITHWAHLHAKPFYDSTGRQDGATAALRLIDEEVAAEQEVEEARREQALAEQRYRQSVDNAPIGMCLITPDGRFYEVNDALCRFFGYDAETLMGKKWQELTAPEYLEADLSNVAAVLDGRLDSYRMIKQYIHADGHPIWGDLSVSCLRDENGSVLNFISQITDITAQEEAEKRSRALTQRLRRQSLQTMAELKNAATYLSSIMPRGLSGRVEVSSRYLPSSELGGDCFDYVWLDEDHLLIYLIDVSGHGLEPALLSVSVHNLLRSGSLGRETLLAPEATLGALNRMFQMDRQHGHYFTLWYGVYQASERTLRYSGAGAPPALAFVAAPGGATTVTRLSSTCPPIGLFPDSEFAGESYSVPAGCQILVFSDGAFEIGLADDRQLSLDGFEALCGKRAGSPDWSLDELIAELKSLTPTKAFDDDCSLIRLAFD